jgi:hypothetical protein
MDFPVDAAEGRTRDGRNYLAGLDSWKYTRDRGKYSLMDSRIDE